MKKITNTAKIVVNSKSDEDIGEVKNTYHAIIAHVNEVNSNGYNLKGDVIEFKREVYPLLYQHNDHSIDGLIGWAKPYFNSEEEIYEADFGFYKGAEKLEQAIADGAFKEVSVSYYVDKGDFNDTFVLDIEQATFAELSIVSVGADPNTTITKNGLSEELQAKKNEAIENARKLKELKEKYECI